MAYEIAQQLQSIESLVSMLRQRGAGLRLPAEDLMPEPVEAYINHGRWVVDCQDEYCRGAEVVSRSDQRFYCLSCGNKACGGRAYAVTFPEDADAIQRALLARPDEGRMNWSTPETLDDLLVENALHGIGV